MPQLHLELIMEPSGPQCSLEGQPSPSSTTDLMASPLYQALLSAIQLSWLVFHGPGISHILGYAFGLKFHLALFMQWPLTVSFQSNLPHIA